MDISVLFERLYRKYEKRRRKVGQGKKISQFGVYWCLGNGWGNGAAHKSVL